MGYHSFLIEDIPDEYPLFIVIGGFYPRFSTARELFGALAESTEDDAAVILPRCQSEVDSIFVTSVWDLQHKHHYFGKGCEQIGLENLHDPHIPKLFTAPGLDAGGLFLVER